MKKIIAITSVILFAQGCAVLETVDKGLYRVAEGVTERDRVTGQRVLSFDDRQAQIAKGNRAVEQFVAQAKQQGVRINGQIPGGYYQRALRIFNRLHAVSHLGHEKWQPIVVENDQWNAFTTGGTYFVMYTALMDDIKDDAELANVVAHEMAHTVANHISEQQGYSTAAALSGSSTAKRDTYSVAFTHESEREADRIAVLYTALAGYDPYGGSRIWAKQYQTRGNNNSYFHTHPAHRQRSEESRAVAEKVKQYYRNGQRNPDYQHILRNNPVYGTAKSNSTEAGQGGGIMAVLETLGSAYEQKNRVKAEERRQAQQVAFIQQVSKATEVRSSRAIGRNTWTVTYRYHGNVPLKNVIMKGAVVRQGAKSPEVVMVSHIRGVVNPGVSFQANFTDAKLDTRRVSSNEFKFAYDDAAPAR